MRGDVDAAKAVYAGTTPLSAEDIADIIVFNRKFAKTKKELYLHGPPLTTVTRKENTVIAETLVFPNHQASGRDIYRS